MIWARMLAYITGTVDQELLLRNEYLTAENRILRAQIKGRLLLSDAEKLRWLRSPTGSDGKPWKNWRLSRNRIRCWPGTESSSPTSSTDRSFANPMLATPLQAIGGTRTFTSQDSQHCRLLLTARYFSEGPAETYRAVRSRRRGCESCDGKVLVPPIAWSVAGSIGFAE